MEFKFEKNSLSYIKCGLVALVLIICAILTWNKCHEILFFYIVISLPLLIKIEIKDSKAWIMDLFYSTFAFVVGSYINHALSLYESSTLLFFDRHSIILYSLAFQGISAYVVEFFLILSLYFFLRCLLINAKTSAIISIIPTTLISITNYFVYAFRGTELTPTDILGATTAMNVAGNYTFPFRDPFLLAYLPLLIYILSVVSIRLPNQRATISKNLTWYIGNVLASFIAIISLFASVYSISQTHKIEYWGNRPSAVNGFITNFALVLSNYKVEKPEGYNADLYNGVFTAPSDTIDANTNIIVIMNESLADMTIYSDLTGDFDDPIPFIRSLQEQPNSRFGYAYSSVFGGNTCNSEFEFLTSITTAHLPVGSIPYSMYLGKPTYSIASYLTNFGYECTAMHPFLSSGWNRTIAYPNLGFNSMMFIDDFQYTNDSYFKMISVMGEDQAVISDRCAYENILSMLDSNNAPQFMFMVTIQNHGGYSSISEANEITNFVSGTTNDDELNTYLSDINQSDMALEFFLSELQNRTGRYVVLIFGDHQPSLELLNNADSDSDLGLRRWLVPYVLWANYDLPDSLPDDTRTSLNYLALDVLNTAGIPLGPYYNLISNTRTSIPVINYSGYYSEASNEWHTISEENSILNQYYGLQYYSIIESNYN
ncbi:MAG: LTA synthase family protein [Saccharofermentans sp.]|nr:LTA synthase family protein [Saccharofermentans sp.]